jgi:hypothetical protein
LTKQGAGLYTTPAQVGTISIAATLLHRPKEKVEATIGVARYEKTCSNT